jgi:hypothetical protein
MIFFFSFHIKMAPNLPRDVLTILFTIIGVILALSLTEKIPYHTSALSGKEWMQDLLEGHEERIHN